MKKFFKNPYIIVWISVFVVFIILAAMSSLSAVLMSISVFLLGCECIYAGVLLLLYDKRKKRVDVSQFINDDDKEKKRATFAQKEGKMNMTIFIMSLFLIGGILVYLSFRTL